MQLLERYKGLSVQLKAAIWFFVCTLFQKGISVITTPVFTRLLSVTEYGKFNLYLSWREVLGIFLTMGLSSSVYQKKLIDLDSALSCNKLTSSLQGLATTTTLIWLVVYLLFTKKLNTLFSLSTEYVILVFVSALMSAAFEFWAMRQRVLYNYKKLVLLTVIVSLSKPILSIIAIISSPNDKVLARVFAIVLVEFLAYIVIYVRQFSQGKQYYNKGYWKYALVYVLPLMPHYFSQRILSQSDRIMINTIVGTREAGIYSLAHSIGWLLTLVTTACDGALAPWVYRSIKEKSYESIKRVSVYLLAFMAALCLVVIAIAPEAVRVFAPKEYYDSAWLIPPLAMSTFFIMTYVFFVYFEYYFERTKYIMFATVASAAINIVLNYVCIRSFGYVAAAYTTLSCYIMYAAFHYVVYAKICKDKLDGNRAYNTKAIAFISIILLILGLSLTMLYNNQYARYSVIAAISFVLVLYRRKIKEIFMTISRKSMS